MSHTPGPWEAAERGDYTDFDGDSRVIIGDDRRIAVVQHSGDQEDEANTHLIAAAPALLEALQDIDFAIECGCGDERWNEVCEKMRAVISNATGAQ